MRFLLDTVTVSALRRPNRETPGLRAWLAETELGDCCISALTRMELQAGVAKKESSDPAQGRVLRKWLDAVLADFETRTLSFDLTAADLAARIIGLRSRGGTDVLIAATALMWDLTLVTRNTKDFHDIPRLRIANPW
jgi:predicted nucleic acid-binding protein